VRDAPLLVLDEPTANLDPETAAVVTDAIGRVAAGRAVLVIEHRPDLVPADRTVVLRPAEVVPRPAPVPGPPATVR
jgi:ABC-type multidrug transport system fused ATPase/permease subunit